MGGLQKSPKRVLVSIFLLKKILCTINVLWYIKITTAGVKKKRSDG